MGKWKSLLSYDEYHGSDEAFARRSDPDTSHQAAASLSDSTVTKMELRVWNYIKSCGDTGATWHEISSGTQIDPASVSPRLKPLCQKLLIKAKRSDATGEIYKRKGRSSRYQIVWVSA